MSTQINISSKLPYKSFTALLTQRGGDVLIYGPGSDDPQPLQIGTTYKIEFNSGGDFTNIGAPNNLVGTYFLATGTTPNSWGVPGDTQLSSNSGAPVATVLENTIGNIWFTYADIGQYYANSNNLFVFDKTVFIGSTFNNRDTDTNIIFNSFLPYGALNYLELICVTVDTTRVNSQLLNTLIEIRVYN